jgi:hypothetical protein
MYTLILLLPSLVPGADPVPAPEDVKAGWGAFAIFIGLAVAVALLGWSLSRHLRKARDNADRGVFGTNDEPRHTAP